MTTPTSPFRVEARLVAITERGQHIVLPRGYQPVGYRVEVAAAVARGDAIYARHVAVLETTGEAIPLPVVLDGEGDYVDPSGFLVDFPNGAVRMFWIGDAALRVTSLHNGYGIEMPLPGAVMLPPGGDITVPHQKPNKVTGAGVLVRDGKVVRDVAPTDQEADQDRLVEEAHAKARQPPV